MNNPNTESSHNISAWASDDGRVVVHKNCMSEYRKTASAKSLNVFVHDTRSEYIRPFACCALCRGAIYLAVEEALEETK
jgi:hypothetical protein